MKKILDTGTLKKLIHSSSYTDEIYNMIWLDEGYLQQVMELQHIAFDGLKDPDIYQLQPERFIKNQFGKEGRTLGMVVQNRLVAFQVLHFPFMASDPDDAAENLGLDLGFPKEELARVAHLETNATHPSYFGNALSDKLAAYLIKSAGESGHYHLCATVSPKNSFILIRSLEAGAIIGALKEKYGGKLRYILYANTMTLSSSPAFRENTRVNITDFAQQQNLLAQGFRGYHIEKTEQGLEIIYGR